MKSIVNKSPTISCIDCSAEKGITNNMFYLLKVLPQLKRYYKYLDQGPRTFVFYTLKQRLLTPMNSQHDWEKIPPMNYLIPLSFT